jgi:bifunctional non-homologous end joining protein LigD
MPVTRTARARSSNQTAPAGFALTHPERVLWPDEGITKGDLAAHYQAVASVLLPHVRDRPVVLRPYPQGVGGASYYRQSLPASAPAWLPRYEYVAKADARPNEMLVVQNEPSLLWLVNQAAIELHPWLSRTDRPDAPDFAVFDLDILDGTLFPLALRAALLLRDELESRGVRCYPKTSGGDGIHVYVPLERGPGYAETRAWSQAVAESLRSRHPDILATDVRLADRQHKVLIDYAQNSLGRTTASVYSVRPRPGATVSTPLTWDEVEAGEVRPAGFTIRTVPARVQSLGDLFAPVLTGGQRLPEMHAEPPSKSRT